MKKGGFLGQPQHGERTEMGEQIAAQALDGATAGTVSELALETDASQCDGWQRSTLSSISAARSIGAIGRGISSPQLDASGIAEALADPVFRPMDSRSHDQIRLL